MTDLSFRVRHSNGHAQPLPLFDYAERQRWQTSPAAARMVRRKCGVGSAAAARAIAELAGFPVGDDR